MKRFFDLSLIFISLPLVLPLFVWVGLWVRIRLGHPIFFRQVRAGLNGKPFEIVKFRTMRDKRDPNGLLLPDSERLTQFGKLLRSTSLDELPELWNVLKGEMSLVGPRPLLMEYLPLYSPQQARRHEVRPGLTGWAQVNGRNAISWDDKFKLDLWYVNHRSILLDIRIILLTLKKVIMRDDISSDGESTMSPFKGNKK